MEQQAQATSEPEKKILAATDDPRYSFIQSESMYPEFTDTLMEPDKENTEAKEGAEGEALVPAKEAEKTEDEKQKTETDELQAQAEDKAKKPKKDPDTLEKELDEERRRIKVITKARHDAERQVEAREKRIKELEEENKTLKSSVPAPDKPSRETFESDEEYIEALTKWSAKMALREEREAEAAKATEKATVKEGQELEAVEEEVEDDIQTMLKRAHKKHDDFDAVVGKNPDVQITESMMVVLMNMEYDGEAQAEDILYYLGKHPEEAEKIASLTPKTDDKATDIQRLKVIKELAKIELKVNAPAPQRKVTSAPEPITPVKTTGAIEKDLSKMSQREYERARAEK
jgi:hypothetical protein